MPAYLSFISDVHSHRSYRVEKIVLHHLIFLLIKIGKCLLVPNAISLLTAKIRPLYAKGEE